MRIRDIARSGAEVKTYRALRRSLEKRGYTVLASVRISDVLDREPAELEQHEENCFRTMHFDFVVAVGEGLRPEFVVEFDGPHHEQGTTSDRLDAVKNKFCKDADLPMLRISSQELQRREEVSVLRWVLERWLAYQEEIPGILREIGEWVESNPDDPLVRAAKAGEYDASFDPSFIFDIRHPYPPILTVTHRLRRLGIVTGRMSPAEVQRWMSATRRKPKAECSTWPGGLGYAPDEWQVTEYRAEVIPWDPNRRTWGSGDPEALYSTVQRVRMRWALPVGWGARDALSGEAGVWGTPEHLEWVLTRARYLWPADLPGAPSGDIAEGLAEYLVLRDVERWALRRWPRGSS
jgi:hypothetical protein